MLLALLLQGFVIFLNVIFSIFPSVPLLPTIDGYSIDSALATNFGMFHQFLNYVWPMKDVWYGFIFLMGYYFSKITLRFILGSRTPATVD